MEHQRVAVGAQPLLEARPLADQRLVCNLDRVFANSDQPGVGKRADDRADFAGTILLGRQQLGHGHATASVLGAFSQLGQSQEDVVADASLRLAELRLIDALGGPGDRAAHLARLGVAAQRHRSAPTITPSFEQRVRQQGQRAGLVAHVAQKQIDEARREAPATEPRRLFDRSPQFLPRHGAEEHLRGSRGGSDRVVRSEVGVEVGAQRHDHGRPVCVGRNRPTRR